MIDMKDILRRVGTLPPLPDTALKLINVVHDPTSTVDDIVGVIQYDQAVTGEVLRLCNSAYFGLSRKITSLNDALLCLGTVKVMQLVMSVHTSTLLGQAQKGYGMDPGVLWKHSVAVALCSGQFAQKLNFTGANLAFTAGLLHDIGKVLLNEYVAEDFEQIVRMVEEEKVSFVAAERSRLGFSHLEIGEKLAESWKLPDPIVKCIRYHHEPSLLEEYEPLVDTIHLADCTCLLLGFGLGVDGLTYPADPQVMERHNLRESDLELIGAQTLIEYKRIESMFHTDGVPQKTGNRE